MDQRKLAGLAWASTGRSAASLDAIERSGQPADAVARLAAAVEVKAAENEGDAGGYEIDTGVADAVFVEHCEAFKTTVAVEHEEHHVEETSVDDATDGETAAAPEGRAATETAPAPGGEEDDDDALELTP